jgi:hypothetical protein
MFRRVIGAALLTISLTLAGCGMNPSADGSRGIRAFLEAVRTGDSKAFEAAIDRPALRADLRDQLSDLGRARGLDVGGASDFALDRRITPQAFHVVDARTGEPQAAPATLGQIANTMLIRDGRHVCLTDSPAPRPGPPTCLLSFTKRDGVWRLTGMPAHEVRIALPHYPPAARPEPKHP